MKKQRTESKHRESAILTLADLHYGKKTATFNPEQFKERLESLGKRIRSIRSHLNGYEFDELVVALLGDVNDGTGIYATQPHHQAVSNVEEQAEQLTDLLVPFFQTIKEAWGKVRIECVPGNHGNAGYKSAHEAASWDTVAYRYLRHKLGKDIPVNFGDKHDPFIRKIDVRGHKYLLYHGHDIKTFGNIPWYGMMLRIARWNTSKLAPFDAVLMGHFHTFGRWCLNRIDVLASGTMVTDDDWALRTLGWESANKTWLFGVSDKRAITWDFGIEL